MKIRIYKGKNGQWNIQLKARNGNILLAATGYNTKRNAVKTMKSVIRHILAKKYNKFD